MLGRSGTSLKFQPIRALDKFKVIHAFWHMPLVPLLGRPRQQIFKFGTSLGYAPNEFQEKKKDCDQTGLIAKICGMGKSTS